MNEPEIYTGRRLETPKPRDLCIIITNDGKWHEAQFVAELHGFMLFRSLVFARSEAFDGAIQTRNIAVLRVVMPMGASTTEKDYVEALVKLTK